MNLKNKFGGINFGGAGKNLNWREEISSLKAYYQNLLIFQCDERFWAVFPFPTISCIIVCMLFPFDIHQRHTHLTFRLYNSKGKKVNIIYSLK